MMTTTPHAGYRLIELAEHLARCSDDPHALTRTYLTPAHRQAACLLVQWMEQAGMAVRQDAAGNVIGRYEGTHDMPALITGSHYDTVRNAGRYDGPLGILAPLLAITQWHSEGRRLRFPIELVAFAEEEGARFRATLLGSRALAGTFDQAVLDNTDQDGVTMREAMHLANLDPAQLPKAELDPRQIAAFVEIHIEQGPVLLESGLALGVVTAISGATRYAVQIQGVAGHAGTVPMRLRRDAAAAAAEITLYIESRCGVVPDLVGTVGLLTVPNGAANVVPGRADLSIDIRSPQDPIRKQACSDVLQAIERIAQKRGVTALVEQTYEAASTSCVPWLQRQWGASLGRLGLAPNYLPSGAGHDGLAMAGITDIAMLFVRCGNGGISHNPAETITADDARLAIEAFADFAEHFEAGPTQ